MRSKIAETSGRIRLCRKASPPTVLLGGDAAAKQSKESE